MSSKTCHSCRRSRLRCDGGQPTCLKCNSRGVECLGYGSRPLLWVQPTSSVVSTSVYSHAARKKGRPKLVLMQQSKNRVEERSVGKFVEHIRVQSSVSALSPLLPAGYTVACSTLDVLMYYNKNVCSDMVALHSPTNPHSIDLDLWPILPDLVVDFFSAVVATHRVIRSQSYGSLSTESPNAVISTGITDRYLDKLTHPLVKNIYKHHQQVIKVLGMLLDDEEIRFSDEIFGIISGLMLFEIQQSAHGSWSVHLEAMRMIVSQRGGFEQLAKEYSLARYMFHLQMFMLVDIMSCVTAASSALGSRVLSQLSYIDYLPQVHRHGLDAAFPCPNELLEGIIYINFIRSGAELASNKSLSVSLRVERLLERIMSFSPVEWAWLCSVDAGFHSSRPDNNSNNVTSDPQVNDLVALASAFQEAVLLFCLRTLVLDRDITSSLSNELSKDIHVIRCNASDSLLTHLRQLFPTGALKRKPAMGKFVSWPLFIAGMECHYSSSRSIDQERSFVLESLYRISYIQADVSVLDIAPFLQRVWKMETDEFIENPFHDTGASWDTRIAMLGNHSPFIFK